MKTKRKALLAIITLLIILAVIEGGTRILLAVTGLTVGAVVPKNIGRFDANLGWSYEPGAKGTSKRTGQEIEYRINSKGLRDDEHEYRKPPGVYRIVAIGDSNTLGFGVPIEKHYTRLLESYFRNLEVINLGVAGFGVDQSLLYLSEEGFKYSPDLVIAFIPAYPNNRHMHLRRFGKSKPRFQLVEGELVVENKPVTPSGIRSVDFLRTIDGLLSISKAYEVLRSFAVSIGRGQKKHKEGDKKNLDDADFQRRFNELGEAIVFQMDLESRRHDAGFVVATSMSRLSRITNEKGLNVLNVAEALGNEAYSLPDGLAHINESGNGVLAWELAKFLMETGLVSERHYLNRPE